jgi:hypothetical protein
MDNPGEVGKDGPNVDLKERVPDTGHSKPVRIAAVRRGRAIRTDGMTCLCPPFGSPSNARYRVKIAECRRSFMQFEI